MTTTKGPAETAGPQSHASPVVSPGSSVKNGPTVPHRCFPVQHLVEMEARVRELQDYHLWQAEMMADYRRAIVFCLHQHHRLSFQDIATHLVLDRSRVQQIAKGK